MRRLRNPLSVAMLIAFCLAALAGLGLAAHKAGAQSAAPVPAQSWDETGRKLVPIVSVGNPGIHIGAAQVVGPRVQVEKVKAVVQLELDFKRAFRIRVYIPVSSIRTDKLDRVQGCSVWALGELGIVKF